MSVLAFVAVRWLQNTTYSNETVVLLAPETQVWCNERGSKNEIQVSKAEIRAVGTVSRELAKKHSASSPAASQPAIEGRERGCEHPVRRVDLG